MRWTTGEDVSLEALRAYAVEVSRDLDPGSRYVKELLATLEASTSVEEYLARLADRERVEAFRQDPLVVSRGERGRSWVDEGTWSSMDPFERTLANLLTGETRMMWAGEGARDYALLGKVLRGLGPRADVLSVPCATGKEAFSIVVAALLAGRDVRVTGVDRQRAYLTLARTGRLVPHPGDRDLPGVEPYVLAGGRVSDDVLSRCEFVHGDVLTGELPPGPFDVVSCRNLLGYFRGDTLEAAWTNVAARVRPGGALLLDGFVTGAPEMAQVPRGLAARGFRRRFPDASYYEAPPGEPTEPFAA